MQQLLLKYVKYGILLYYFINFTYLSYFTLPRLFYPTKLQTPALPLLVIKISRCLYFYVEPSYTPPLSLVYIIGGPKVNRDLEGPCKQTQHVGTTSPNIVGMALADVGFRAFKRSQHVGQCCLYDDTAGESESV